MKVWLVWEDLVDERILLAVVSSREKVDEIVKQHYGKYGSDAGELFWEEWELDTYEGGSE